MKGWMPLPAQGVPSGTMSTTRARAGGGALIAPPVGDITALNGHTAGGDCDYTQAPFPALQCRALKS